jgi:hypothetical protein
MRGSLAARNANPIRWRRLKTVFEGRQVQLEAAQLEAARQHPWPPDYEARCAYSTAVIKYTKARNAWRAFRGFS